MARKRRIEYEHAFYHVIHPGNYRADVFASEGAKVAFEKCLCRQPEKTPMTCTSLGSGRGPVDFPFA